MMFLNIVLLLFFQTDWQDRPFPDAYGFGAGSATDGNYGGSGRHMSTPNPLDYHVENLNDDGAGSLRYGLEGPDVPARMIYFDIAGEIILESPIRITSPYVTIAGETAPGRVVIRNYFISIETHDVVIRFITCRLGDGALDHYSERSTDFEAGPPTIGLMASTAELEAGYEIGMLEGILSQAKKIASVNSAMQISLNNANGVTDGTGTARYISFAGAEASEMRSLSLNNASQVVLDHVSASWGIDAIIEHGNGGGNVTFQFCFFGEGLEDSYHTDGSHSKGLTISSSLAEESGLSLIGTLLLQCKERNPRLSTLSGKAEILNSVIFNIGNTGTHRAGIFVNAENYETRLLSNFLQGDGGGSWRMLAHNDGLINSFTFVSHNIGPGRPSDTGDEWGIASPDDDPEDFQAEGDFNFALPYPHVPFENPIVARDFVLRFSGDRPGRRDDVDERYVSDAFLATGAIINSQEDVEGYLPFPTIDKEFLLVSSPNDEYYDGWTRRDWQLHILAKRLTRPQKAQIF